MFYIQNTPFLYPGFYFNFFIAKKYHGPNHDEKRKQIEVYRQQRLQSKYHLNSPIPNHCINNYESSIFSSGQIKINNNNPILQQRNNSNNRGRFITSNAINEMRHIHQQSNNSLQNSTPDQYNHYNHHNHRQSTQNQFGNNNQMSSSIPLHVDGNNSDNNNNNNNTSNMLQPSIGGQFHEKELHFFPKMSLINKPANNMSDLMDMSQLQQQHNNNSNHNNNHHHNNHYHKTQKPSMS